MSYRALASRHPAVTRFALTSLLLLLSMSATRAQITTNDPAFYGPFNAVFMADGEGLRKPLLEHDSVLRAGIGNPTEEYPRYLALDANKLILWMGKDNSLTAPAVLSSAKWHFLAATFDGNEFRLYSDGALVGSGKLDLGSVSPVLQMAPPNSPWRNGQHFGGKIASLTLERRALEADEIKIKQLHQQSSDFSLTEFEQGSKPWPVQTRAQAGYRAPQDPSTMPVSKTPIARPVAIKSQAPQASAVLQESGNNFWTLETGWMLSAAPDVKAEGAEIAQPVFNTRDWMHATIPGTVLTTMIDRGIYPDPDYGLNNLAIPESLNKQDYWYRTEFEAPNTAPGTHLTLTFEGINYAASVWLNGESLGTIKGAFIRGIFDVTRVIKLGQANVLAVRISPPPHPGIPQEQSIKGGPGENGGIMCLDGPTFVATEGWDWIPAIRDRDTGIWQPVTLTASGGVRIGDPQIVTTLPLPDTSRADVEISVPLENK